MSFNYDYESPLNIPKSLRKYLIDIQTSVSTDLCRYTFKFPNNRGCIVARSTLTPGYAYGLWSIAYLVYPCDATGKRYLSALIDDEYDSDKFMTDVEGSGDYLTDLDVNIVCKAIYDLPPFEGEIQGGSL